MPTINLAASRRLGGVLLIAFLGAALVFFVMRAGHGDPALAALGDQATPEAIAAFHKRWGLDAPLVVQFWRWLSGALVGNFGMSMTVAGGVPIAGLIGSRLPNTLFIGFYAMAIAVAMLVLWSRGDVFAALLIGGLPLAGSAMGRCVGMVVDGFSITHAGFAVIEAIGCAVCLAGGAIVIKEQRLG